MSRLAFGVTGPHTRSMNRFEKAILKDLLRGMRPHLLIHGGARGIDSDAGEIAHELGIEVEVHEADWKTHGKKAGPIRNRRQAGKAHVWMAFVDRCGPGTRDMIRAAKQSGAAIITVDTSGMVER